MVPLIIVPVLLIAKASVIIPAGETPMRESELEQYLVTVRRAREEGFRIPSFQARLQAEIDGTAGFLVAVHSSLVLTQAAARTFDGSGQMKVASFLPDDLVRIEDRERFIESVTGAADSGRAIVSQSLNIYHTPYIKVCLGQAAQLPANFQVGPCLDTCRAVAGHVGLRDKYIQEAIDVVQAILQTADLDQVQDWVDGGPHDPDPVTDTKDWITAEFDLDKLHTRIAKVYDALTPAKSRQGLNQIQAMLVQSRYLFQEVLQRFQHASGAGNDLKEAIEALPAGLPAGQKQAWNNMLLALYGATAWRIFRQTQMAVLEANALMNRFGEAT
jgi:hypothetical protein